MVQTMTNSLIHHLEELAANALPAEMVQVVDGWRLRFTWNIARRANSVWPNAAGDYHSLQEKLQTVEAFYGRFHTPVRFQMTPAAQPSNLDEILAERGYRQDSMVDVQTADLATVLAQAEPAHQVVVSPNLDADWFTAYRELGGFSSFNAEVRRRLFQRIATPAVYTAVWINGRIIGVGTGVYERGWVGVFNMQTHPEYRRQGIATAILHALAEWGQEQTATKMYLQVAENNEAAQTVYGRLGFTTLYTYHYRELPTTK